MREYNLHYKQPMHQAIWTWNTGTVRNTLGGRTSRWSMHRQRLGSTCQAIVLQADLGQQAVIGDVEGRQLP